MNKVNGIDMDFFFKEPSKSPETDILRVERNLTLHPQRIRIFGKGRENERVQEYRTGQQGRKQAVNLNILIYSRIFHYSLRNKWNYAATRMPTEQ